MQNLKENTKNVIKKYYINMCKTNFFYVYIFILYFLDLVFYKILTIPVLNAWESAKTGKIQNGFRDD